MSESQSIKGFRFTPTGIAGILKTHRLKVPPYQREYAWGTDQVSTLYTGFSRAKSENNDYFLGTIVTIRSGRSDPIEIVDGQQRLTTTSLLIASIRDQLGMLGMEGQALESVNTDFLSTFDRKQNARISKLILNIDDHAFFEALVNGKPIAPSRESHNRLIEASKAAQQHVKSLVRTFSTKDQPSVLNDWLEFLEHGATVILVETQNGAQAFKMFETLNDRGLKTSQADLVKSYLFGQSGGRIQEAQSRWSSLKDNLEEIDDDDRAINFLRHAIIATRKFVRAEDVYDFSQTIRGESNATSFLTELERLSRIYVATYRSTSNHWASYPVSAQRALAIFNKFDIKPVRPLLLSLAVSMSETDFSKAMVLLVSICVRLSIAGNTRSGTIENAFSSVAAQVYQGQIVKISEIKTALKGAIISDSDFREAFVLLRISRADLARYYLQTLEASNAGESEPWFVTNDDPSVMTLDHIMPSSSNEADWPGIDEDEKNRSVKRLGNLCVLNKAANNGARSDSFEKKKKYLALAPYKLTSEIASEISWNFEAIERRQKRLADLAVKAWPV